MHLILLQPDYANYDSSNEEETIHAFNIATT